MGLKEKLFESGSDGTVLGGFTQTKIFPIDSRTKDAFSFKALENLLLTSRNDRVIKKTEESRRAFPRFVHPKSSLCRTECLPCLQNGKY